MGHGSVARTAKGLRMKVGVIKFAVYFTGLDLTKGDLFFDIVDDHQEMFAFLGMGTVLVSDGDNGAVVFHHDGWKRDGEAEFLTEGDDVVEILGEGKYGAGFSLGGGGCDRCLLDTAVVESSSGSSEGDAVSSVAFAVCVGEVRSVDLAVELEWLWCCAVEDMSEGFGMAKVVHNVVEVAEVSIGWFAGFGTSEGDCRHDVRAAIGEV